MRSSLLLLTLGLLTCPRLAAQEEKGPTPQQRAEMRRQLMLAGPGPEHARLKRLAGDWDLSMTMRSNEVEYSGTARAEMILGERFLVIDGQGEYMKRSSAFRYTIGFDRRHDEYTIILLDTAGTYHVAAKGKATEKGIRMTGTDDDPRMKAMGFGQKKFAFDLEVVSDDEFAITTLFVDTRGEEERPVPTFAHIFKRKKADED